MSLPYSKIQLCATAALTILLHSAAAQTPNPGTPWPAVDELGRALPLAKEVGLPKPDRFVGIFYFLWQGYQQYLAKQQAHQFFGAPPSGAASQLYQQSKKPPPQ